MKGEEAVRVFDEDGLIDSDVQDILYELGNVGLGMASITMGRLMGVRMDIGVPSVAPSCEYLEEKLNGISGKTGILMEFQKTLNGYMVFLLDDVFVDSVARTLCEEEFGSGEITDRDRMAALEEFANLICAAYLKAISSYTGIRIYVKPVEIAGKSLAEGIREKIGKENGVCTRAICVDAGFDVRTEDGRTIKDMGSVIMLPDEESVQKLIEPLAD